MKTWKLTKVRTHLQPACGSALSRLRVFRVVGFHCKGLRVWGVVSFFAGVGGGGGSFIVGVNITLRPL